MCSIRINGIDARAKRGESLAAAMINGGVDAMRTSVSGERRGPLCGMGVCYECRADVNGAPHQRMCMGSSEPGVKIDTTSEASAGERSWVPDVPLEEVETDVLVVGAGPAGLAAAAMAGESGCRVLLLDDNAGTGGQIWRKDAASRSAAWRERVSRAGVRTICSATVVAKLDDGRILAMGEGEAWAIGSRRIVLATGSTELFLPFTGWTLPGVMGVGGLQAMVKSGLDIRGKRVVISGSGPLLLAVAASLQKCGADVRMVAEQAPLGRVVGMARGLWRRPRKLVQGMALKAALVDVEQRFGWWTVEASGPDRVSGVALTDGARVEMFECDYLATGFGLVPSTRVAALLGCRAEDRVVVDERQQTSVEGVFAAGECTGIGGVDKALVEGRMAGLMCAGLAADASRLARARDRELSFAGALATSFALRDELKQMARPETLVCRCEDVAWGRISAEGSWREAKLQTRCGMGPCQGRICGPAVRWLTGWKVEDARPPVFNVPLGVLAAMDGAKENA